MPFYSCNVPAGSLADDQKDDLAQAITRIHVEVTGAPPDLVHVIYVGDGKIMMQTAFFIDHWSTAQRSTPSPSMSIRPTCS